MDLNPIVCRWLDSCLRGEMTVEDLLAALRQLDADLLAGSVPVPDDVRLRFGELLAELETILAHGHPDPARIQSAAGEFFGQHLARIRSAQGAPGWSIEG